MSPQWVVQSAMTGCQERCLRLSPDALQCLHPLDRPLAMAQAQVRMLVEAQPTIGSIATVPDHYVGLDIDEASSSMA